MYINTNSNQVVSEQEIKAAFPNTSFSVPFNPPTYYKWIFPAPQPTHNPVIQSVRSIAPELTGLGHYEERWEVIPRFTEYTDENDVLHTVSEQEAAAIAADAEIKTAATLAPYDKALTDHLDATAQARRWENRITLMSRAGFPGPWQQDAIAYGTWADTCNAMGYQMVEDYQAGLIPLPTIAEVIAALPEMVWPE